MLKSLYGDALRFQFQIGTSSDQDSLMDKERKEKEEQRRQLKAEAEEDQLVKRVQNIFPESEISEVSVLGFY